MLSDVNPTANHCGDRPQSIDQGSDLVEVQDIGVFPRGQRRRDARAVYDRHDHGAVPEDGAGFVTWDCSGADNQLFTFDVGWSVLHSGKCLAVDNRGDEPYPEQLVQQWEPFAGEKLAEARVRAVRTF